MDFDPRADAPIDAPPFAIRGDCEGHETAVFCDGFEDPALAKWVVVSGQTASMQSQAPLPPHGTRLLESTTQTTQQGSYVTANVGPYTTGTLYLRGWFYVPSNIDLTHFDLFDLNSDGMGGVSAFLYFGALTLFQSSATPSAAVAGPPLPLDRWMCLELQLEIGDPGNVYLSLDGTQVASFTGIDLLPGTGFHNLLTGIPWTDDGQQTARAYTDEIIVDTRPIPCD